MTAEEAHDQHGVMRPIRKYPMTFLAGRPESAFRSPGFGADRCGPAYFQL
jgi:hypothetical protein